MAVKVDLDLFVNAASKGFNDGAKVPSAFGAFLQGINEGIDKNYENDLKAQQAEATRIQNEQAPLRTDILTAQAEEAKLKTAAMQENPEAFKDTIIKKAEADRAQKEQAAAYETKKAKLTELYNSGDGKAMGEAYLSREFKEVFLKDKALNEQYKSAYPEWAPETQQTYQTQERQKRAVETNESLYNDAVTTYEKIKPDYVANPELNILKEKIKADTGSYPSDQELFENGVMAPIRGPKQIPQRVPVIGADGKPEMLAGKVPKTQIAPPGAFGVPFQDDPTAISAGDFEDRNVFNYGGKSYQVGAGFSSDSLKVFNTMQSSYRRKNYLDKDQGGTTDLTFMNDEKKKAENDAVAKAQADAAQSNEQIQVQRDQFLKGADVATQQWAKKQGIVSNLDKSTKQTVVPVFPTKETVENVRVTPATDRDKQEELAQLFGDDKIVPLSKQAAAIPTVPQVLPTAVASKINVTNSNVPWSGDPYAMAAPLTEAQQNQLIKKQAQAVKGNEFLSKYQKTPDAQVTPPVSPAAQAAVTAASPYIPKQVSTNIPYRQNLEAIAKVASAPEMAGLSGLAKAVAVQESGGVNSAKSPTGVDGIMQVTSGTGKGINPEFDKTNAVQSAIAGARTLSILEEKYPNNPMLSLTAYNAGTVVVNEAVRLAGTSNWAVVKDFLEEAGNSERVQSAWFDDFKRAGFSDSKARKLALGKVKEASSYAEKVIVNFPAFASNADDNRKLQLLKQQGVFRL